MATAMRGAWLGLVALALSSPVSAQSVPVYQSGTITPGHAIKSLAPGLIGDAGATLTTPTLAAVATSGSASDLTLGTLPSARLAGSYTGITGVGTLTAGVWNGTKIGLAYGGTNSDLSGTGGGHKFLAQSSLGAAITVVQPAAGDVSGLAASATSDTTNAANITAGTLASARGGAGTITGALKGNGSGVVSQAACADLSNASVYCPAALGQLPGTTTNDSASSGNIGQVVSSLVTSGSATPLTNATLADITSINVPAGDWDIRGNVYFNAGATTTITAISGYIHTTSATDPGTTGPSAVLAATLTTGKNQRLPLPAHSYKFSGTTTVYLIGYSEFGTSTMGGYGWIEARRVR